MSFQPFLIGDYRVGLQQNLDPWKLLPEAFQTVENMDMQNGVLKRRFGYRRLAPFTNLCASISGITQANPAVVTSSGDHGLSNGDEVIIRDVVGMTEVNNTRFVVTDVTATTFELEGTDSSAYTAYSSGGHIHKVSQNPIMGFVLHRDSNDDEELLVGDTEFIAAWDAANTKFTPLEVDVGDISAITQANPGVVTTSAAHGLSDGDKVRLDNVVGMTEVNDNVYTVANVTATTFELQGENTTGFTAYGSAGDVYLQNVFTGDATNFLHWVNYQGSVYIANGNDQMLAYDGTTLTRVLADFSDGSTSNDMNAEKFVFVMKERLIALSTTESSAAKKQRARWSKAGAPTNWQDQDNGGTGGYVDAPTGDPIVSAAMLQDDLIVFFRKSTWRLRYTGNAILPFRWELISSTRKTESSFSTVMFDRFVTSLGTTGLLACNGTGVQRFDMQIPDFTRQFNADLFARYYGYKFEETERTWYTYADNTEESVNHVLVHHFDDQGFTTYNLGQTVSVSAVTQADPGVVTTTEDHGLNDGDRVSFSGLGGMTELNSNVYVVANKTDDTFELQGVDTSGFTAYTSGGSVVKGLPASALGEWSSAVDDVAWQAIDEKWPEYARAWNDGRFQIGAAVPLMGDSIGEVWELERGGADRAADIGSSVTGLDFTSKFRTMRFNPFVKEGVNCELGYVDILFSRDSAATVEVKFYLDSEGQNYAISEQLELSYDLERDRGSDTRLWKRVYVGATGAWHEMELSTAGQEEYVEIHAMIFWFRPAGRLELHA